ncbi:6953_t:CDS:2 [Entrophospora sp. SA101]|nr:6953_t:CDS:2 [Entrophospora sp. SA101]CAJ0868522.1 5208_t:CDS:2 [Entrophospora sp. SA101]
MGKGATIAKVDEYLRKHEPPLAIESMTVLDTIRFGGTIATGCHGAITDSRTLAEQVVGLEIVTSSGEVQKFEYDPNNPDEMEAARVNLGLFGVIYKISFLVKPMYKLRMKDTYPELKSFTGENIKDFVKNPIVDGVEIFYWPFNESRHSTDSSKDKLWIKVWENIINDQQPSLNQDQVKAFRRKQEGFSRLANGFYKHLIDDPTKTPKITHGAGLLRKEFIDDKINNLVWEVPDATHYQAGIDNILCRDLEFAIKADKDFENIITELNYIVDRIYEEKQKKKYPINLVVELRILKSSTALLSTAYDEDPDAYYFFIEVLSFRYFNKHNNTCIDTEYFEEFSNELAQRWMEKYNARPHWAKSWEDVPNIKGYLHNLLKERIQRFEAVRAKYDPTNMFFDNDSLREVFYGPGNLK